MDNAQGGSVASILGLLMQLELTHAVLSDFVVRQPSVPWLETFKISDIHQGYTLRLPNYVFPDICLHD